MEINVDGLLGYGDFVIQHNSNILIAGLFDRSRIRAKAIGCKFGVCSFTIQGQTFQTIDESGWHVDYTRVPVGNGRDSFYYTLAARKEIGETYLVTTKDYLNQDLYNLFMKKYTLPLLQWWVPVILEEGIRHNLIAPILTPENAKRKVIVDRDNAIFSIHHTKVPLSELLIYSLEDLDNESFAKLVGTCLQSKKIYISKKQIPLMEFTSFDEYIEKYGSSLVSNLEKQIKPLSPLKEYVENHALKHKRLYPQQAACVNGLIALKRNGYRYGIANEGMGTGKTIQAASVVEAYFNQLYMSSHPDASISDLYAAGNVNYRVIVMCPGHLVEKWVDEFNSEIPNAEAVILNDFGQLLKIRETGKVRRKKEIFVLSKDFCKLGSQLSPIPTQVKTLPLKAPYCKDCLENEGTQRIMVGTSHRRKCPHCNGKRQKVLPVLGFAPQKGLICPNCGELLLNIQNPEKEFSSGDKKLTLMPWDMAKHTSMNHSCYLCGYSLWGVNVKPVDCGGEYSSLVQRKPKWKKIRYFKNARQKSVENAFVLKGYETDYLHMREIVEYEDTPYVYGARKTAPAQFIKKYLKGYFDLAIIDEVHKFEGAGTAQANAAHALINASDFTLGLTGTIANGSAGSFFYLLYMLDPRRMLQKGYSWSSGYMKFCKDYGSIESVYEMGTKEDVYHGNSRGRLVQSPKPVPGISPMLFVDFLLDKCVFLDITDLSQYLPPLHEYVETFPLPPDVQYSYNATIQQLREAMRKKEGRSAMTQILNFGLSYPDKVYGRKDIMSTYIPGLPIAYVDSYDKYQDISVLMPKEQRMLEIINTEIAENRNCFVFACYTGEAETNITYRLQQIIEKYCNLKGQVQIISATNPAPLKREKWIQQKAADGIRVFITNPKCVETGLDFCFNYKGTDYNYPTLIFMQISHEMAVIWQASRRSYRLNQRKECRTFYLAYENTLQTAALEIMAQKQIATSAIQGKFSTEGLAAMAKGVDTRTQLAAALSKNDMSNRETLSSMFDVLNKQNNIDKAGKNYTPPKTYYELLKNVGSESVAAEGNEIDIFSLASMMLSDDTLYKSSDSEKDFSLSTSLKMLSPLDFDVFDFFNSVNTTGSNVKVPEENKKIKKSKLKDAQTHSLQISLSDLYAS